MTFQFTDSLPPTDLPPRDRDGTNLPDPLRLVAVGSRQSIEITILSLHNLGYADPNDWSPLLPTGRANEMMAILTKRINHAG